MLKLNQLIKVKEKENKISLHSYILLIQDIKNIKTNQKIKIYHKYIHMYYNLSRCKMS